MDHGGLSQARLGRIGHPLGPGDVWEDSGPLTSRSITLWPLEAWLQGRTSLSHHLCPWPDHAIENHFLRVEGSGQA